MEKLLLEAKEAAAINLHHDAITGTHVELCNREYKRYLDDANGKLTDLERVALDLVVTPGEKDYNSATDATTFEVLVFNPSLQTRTDIVKFENGHKFLAFETDGETLTREAQIMPILTYVPTQLVEEPTK